MQEKTIENTSKYHVIYCVFVVFATLGSSSMGIQLSSFVLSPFRILFCLMVCVSLFSRMRFYLSAEVSPIYKFWTMLFIYALITGIWAKNKGIWLSGVVFLLIGVIILLLFLKFEGIQEFFDLYGKIIAISLVVVALWGWYEMITGNYLFLKNERVLYMYSFADRRAPVFIFANTNNFAMYVTFSLLLLFPKFLYERISIKLSYVGIILLCFPLLLFSQSRANVLGLILGIAVWWYASSKGRMTIKKFILGSIILLVIIFGVIGFWDKVYLTLDDFFYLWGESAKKSSSNLARLNHMKNAFSMVLNTAGLGVGSGNSAIQEYHIYDTGGVVDLHNWWLLILCEYGVLFGVLNIFLYFMQIRKLVRFIHVEDNHELSVVLITFLAIDIAFTICLISPSNVIAFEWLWVYWGIRFSWVNRYCLNRKNSIEIVGK